MSIRENMEIRSPRTQCKFNALFRRLSPHAQGLRRALAIAAFPICLVASSQGQVLFTEDFSGSLDPAKWRTSNQPFESGITDITATSGGGYLTFSGTDTAGWWGGASVVTIPSFKASPETNLVFEVDRASEYGTGTASRSGVWITDANRQNFVWFGDNRGEGNWRYNRRIGAEGDNPTGSGTAIPAFADAAFTDLGSHRIKMIANGQSVKLYLDDVFGAEVDFPFSEGIVFEIGAYARAVNDTAGAYFANTSVRAEQSLIFANKTGTIQNRAQVLVGETSTNITVKIPAGLNASSPFTVRVITSDPSVVVPVGAVGDTLTVTFASGAPGLKEVPVKALKNGAATLTAQNDADVLIGNSLIVFVPYGSAGVILADTFSGPSYDTTKWELNPQGFEAGVGNMTVTTADGQLKMNGGLAQQYWGGVSLKTVQDFVATKDMRLVFEIDRVALRYTGTAARTGVYITTSDRSQFVFFGQNLGETGWAVNTNPGNPTNGGTAITAFAGMNDGQPHKLRLEADGTGVDVYLDGVYGGRFGFPVTTGIRFEVGAYARAEGDTAEAAFDNVQISSEYSPITATASIVTASNQTDQQVTVTVSPSMLLAGSATVTVTSQNPGVAVPTGSVSGQLTLTFPTGGSNSQTFAVTPVAVGTTTFELASGQGVKVANNVQITVTESLYTLLSDDFDSSSLSSKWKLDERGLERLSTFTNGSYVAISNGAANIHVVAAGIGETADMWWGGMGLTTVQTFAARPTAPVSFEIDRLAHSGTGAERRTAILISDANRQNWVMFSDNDLNGGWVVDTSAGTLRQVNTGIAAFTAASFRDSGLHRMKLLANGSTVKIYLDGVLGAEVPFAVAQDIVFSLGAYARSYPDSVTASFDNAQIVGPVPPIRTQPTTVTIEASQTTNEVITLVVPASLHDNQAVNVTVTSSNPSVAIPVGGINGSLTLAFPAGLNETQTFQVARVGTGTATFTFSNDAGVASTNTLTVIVQNAQPKVLLSENFDSGSLSSLWQIDQAFRFEAQHVSAAADTTASMSAGTLDLSIYVISNYWPGIQIVTKSNFQASLTEPLTLEIDRVAHYGNGTGTRAGVYVYAGTNFVWFGDDVESGLTWGYNYEIGLANDLPTGSATQIAAFSGDIFRDFGNHRIKMVINGQTASLYLDGIFGVEVPFPFTGGLTFGIMGAARAEADTLTVNFDNLVITGSDKIVNPAHLNISNPGANVVITWTESGTLQQSDSLNGEWTDISNAVSPYTVPSSGLGQQMFYRLRQ